MSDPVAASGTVTLEPAELEDSTPTHSLTPLIQSVFDKFAPAARALETLTPYRGGTLLVVGNVEWTIRQVHDDIPRLAEIAELDPDDFYSLPMLARAVHYADMQVRGLLETPEIDRPEKRLRWLRNKGLDTMALGVYDGHFTAAKVAELRAGRDRADLVDDSIRIAAFFEGKHHLLGGFAISSAEVVEMAELAHDMLGDVVPAQNKVRASDKREYPIILFRNQLYTLLGLRYSKLRDVSPALYGRKDADEKVPLLHARAQASVRKSEVLLPELEGVEPDDSDSSES